MNPDFETIKAKLAAKLAKFACSYKGFEAWTNDAEDWLLETYSNPDGVPDMPEPRSTRILTGWTFDSEDDDMAPTDLEVVIGLMMVIAPGIIIFKANENEILDLDIFGLMEQIETDPACFQIHQFGIIPTRLHLVGRDQANPKSLYHELVLVSDPYYSSPGYSEHLMISEADWLSISQWLTKWLTIPKDEPDAN